MRILIFILVAVFAGCASISPEAETAYYNAQANTARAQAEAASAPCFTLAANPGETIELKGVHELSVRCGGSKVADTSIRPMQHETVGSMIREGSAAISNVITGAVLYKAVNELGRPTYRDSFNDSSNRSVRTVDRHDSQIDSGTHIGDHAVIGDANGDGPRIAGNQQNQNSGRIESDGKDVGNDDLSGQSGRVGDTDDHSIDDHSVDDHSHDNGSNRDNDNRHDNPVTPPPPPPADPPPP